MSLSLELRFHSKEKHFPTWYDDTYGVEHPCFVACGMHRSKDNVEFYCEAYQFYFTVNLGIGLFGVAKKSKALGTYLRSVRWFGDLSRIPQTRRRRHFCAV